MTITERIDAAIKRITDGHGAMRVPADTTDPDLVLADCKVEMDRLKGDLSGLRRERAALKARAEKAEAQVLALQHPVLKSEWDQPQADLARAVEERAAALDRAVAAEALVRAHEDQAVVVYKEELRLAVAERDDYRARAIQRQHDFDAAAHACDVLQGKLDKAVEERDAALVLCLSDAWDVEVLESDYTSEVYAAHAMLRSRGLLGGER